MNPKISCPHCGSKNIIRKGIRKNKKIIMRKCSWLLISLLLFVFILIPEFVTAFSCTIRSGSCNAGEHCLFSMWNLTNSHVADCGFYTRYAVCCNVDSSTLRQNACNSDEGGVLSLSNTINSHAETYKYSNYNYHVCIKPNVACRLKSSCSSGEVSVVSMYNLTNSHVAELNYYSNQLCCKQIPQTVTFRLSYSIGTDKSNDVFRIPTSSVINNSVSTLNYSTIQLANNLTHAYICTYDKTEYANGLLLSLITSGKKSQLSSVNFTTNQTTNYTLVLKQKTDTSLILAFARGDCTLVENRMNIVESQTLPNKPFTSFTFGSVREIPYNIRLKYDRIDINGNGTFSSGAHRIAVDYASRGMNNKPQIVVKR